MAAESIAFVAQSVQLYLTAAEPEGGKPRVDTRLESRNPLQIRTFGCHLQHLYSNLLHTRFKSQEVLLYNFIPIK